LHCVFNDFVNPFLGEFCFKHSIEKAGEVAMHSFVTRNKFVDVLSPASVRVFSTRKIEQKEPEKKYSLYGCKATRRSVKRTVVDIL